MRDEENVFEYWKEEGEAEDYELATRFVDMSHLDNGTANFFQRFVDDWYEEEVDPKLVKTDVSF